MRRLILSLVLADIRNGHGERLDATFTPAAHSDPAAVPDAVVVIAHGVTGNKDRPWLIGLSEALARAGLPSLRVSFAGNGGSEGRFEECVLTKEVEDLGSVLDALDHAGFRRLAYVGHSMGGAIGVLRASGDPRIACLVSLAGMVHVRTFFEQTFGGLRFGDPMLGNPACPWNPALAADATRIGSLTSHASSIRAPWLLVHGDADELVPCQHALDAVAAAGGRAELVMLRGVDHRFTGAVPQMIEAVVPWLAARLAAAPPDTA
jgi:dipeptidyl aminopeptidase/acylaminoacyl peptidase